MNNTTNTNETRLREVVVLDNMPRVITNLPPEGEEDNTHPDNLLYITGDLIIDFDAELVFKNGEILDLTPTEYSLLLHLVQNVSWFCSRRRLRQMVSSRFRHEIADNTLSKHIHRTRAKLQQTPQMKYVVTQNCRGYKWNLPVEKKYIEREPLKEKEPSEE